MLFTARHHGEHGRIRARRRMAYARVPLAEEIFERAIEVQAELARSGRHRLPIPDLIVASAAEAAGFTVLHSDSHFDRIAQVTGRPVEWVAPRGTV